MSERKKNKRDVVGSVDELHSVSSSLPADELARFKTPSSKEEIYHKGRQGTVHRGDVPPTACVEIVPRPTHTAGGRPGAAPVPCDPAAEAPPASPLAPGATSR